MPDARAATFLGRLFAATAAVPLMSLVAAPGSGLHLPSCAVALIRVEARRRDLAADLSHGQKQWLEIGMLLAQDPKVLLVDEPAAGMTDAETMQTAELLRSVAGAHSVVVVEHDMAFVRALDVKVTVLHQGAVLAEGSIDHVSAAPEVVDVYLGR